MQSCLMSIEQVLVVVLWFAASGRIAIHSVNGILQFLLQRILQTNVTLVERGRIL